MSCLDGLESGMGELNVCLRSGSCTYSPEKQNLLSLWVEFKFQTLRISSTKTELGSSAKDLSPDSGWDRVGDSMGLVEGLDSAVCKGFFDSWRRSRDRSTGLALTALPVSQPLRAPCAVMISLHCLTPGLTQPP